jgi:hypothetical protein
MIRFFHALAFLSPLLLCGSCGGPNIESKSANAIQTLLSYTAEALLIGGSGSVSQTCSGGGSLSYDATGITLLPGQSFGNIPVSFSDCVIKVCGDQVTFKTSSSKATLKILGLDENDAINLIGGGALIGANDKFFELELLVNDQEVEGFLSGSLSFSYKMRIIGNNQGLKKILILDASSSQPLKIQNKSIPASSIQKLADRC